MQELSVAVRYDENGGGGVPKIGVARILSILIEFFYAIFQNKNAFRKRITLAFR